MIKSESRNPFTSRPVLLLCVTTFIKTYVKERASRNLLWLGEFKPVLCDILGEWDGVGREQGSRGSGHMYTSGWFMLMYAETNARL